MDEILTKYFTGEVSRPSDEGFPLSNSLRPDLSIPWIARMARYTRPDIVTALNEGDEFE